MAKMGGSPPYFEGKNFAYWKVRMAAYLDAIAPKVWLATKTGFTENPTPEQLKWNTKARNVIFEAISEEVFARVNVMDLEVIFGRSSLKFMKAPLKFVSKNITCLELSMILLKC